MKGKVYYRYNLLFSCGCLRTILLPTPFDGSYYFCQTHKTGVSVEDSELLQVVQTASRDF